MKISKGDLYEWAGEFYLTENLPDNWQELPDSQLYDWVSQNAWEPFENWSGKELWEQIDTLALSAQHRLQLEVE